MNREQKIILNIGTHGDEKIGLKVASAIKKLKIRNGKVIFNIANKRAFKLNKRFIDQDLNRSFPGRKNGNHEEMLAYKLLPLIKSADIVIDIHSTTSELKDALIVTHMDKKTREYINVIKPKYALLMKATKNTALISNAKVGLAFEYGKDKDSKATEKVIVGIKNLLSHLGMIDHKTKRQIGNVKFFNVYKAVPKSEGAKLYKKIKNYKIVKKGEIYAVFKNKKIKSSEDFYPILFGEKNYEKIFGFAGKKID